MDLRLSVLRLAPDNRAAALARTRGLALPLRRIAAFALGGDERPGRADRANYPAWIAAARCRAPLADWSDALAVFDLDDGLPDGLRPAVYRWRASYKTTQYLEQSWKTPEFSVSVACDAAQAPPERIGGLLGRVTQALTGRIGTDWAAIPTAAANRGMEVTNYWAGELHMRWVTQWLAYVWPQSPAAAHMKGAVRLTTRMDEDASNWTPGHGFFHALFQPGRPWREPGHLLLCLGLAGKDADCRGLAVDALIEGIGARLFDPVLFAGTMTKLAEGEWLKLNRLGDALMPVIQVSEPHAAVVGSALQHWLPALDLQQKNAFRLLEVLVEARALSPQPFGLGAREALARVSGSGKAAKIARQLLQG